MDFQYGPFDGVPFQGPDALFPDSRVMNFIMQHGEQALDAMAQIDDPDEQAFIEAMIDAGLLEEYEDEQGNRRLRMTPRMVKGLQHRALMQIFEGMRPGHKDGHPVESPGRTTERSEGTRPYQFGDPLGELELGQTMRNAMARQIAEASRAGGTGAGLQLPLRIGPQDFELHNTDTTADCATAVLIDLSGSMMRYGRYMQAKRVAMGMAAMIREKFPLDTIDFVGFYTLAKPMNEQDVVLTMPKPVTIHDYQVRLRVPLDQAYANEDKIPLHFTNLQLGLRTARQQLAKRGAANKQIFVITDGQPTAHAQPSPTGDGEMLYLLYPPTQETAEITLTEAIKCQQAGIRIATFALIEDYYGMDWVGFVDQLTRLTRGTAFYCTSDDLSSTVVESYLKGKKTKQFVR